jgi:hypothetical protein
MFFLLLAYIEPFPDDNRRDGHLGPARFGPGISGPLLFLDVPLLLPPQTHHSGRKLLPNHNGSVTTKIAGATRD